MGVVFAAYDQALGTVAARLNASHLLGGETPSGGLSRPRGGPPTTRGGLPVARVRVGTHDCDKVLLVRRHLPGFLARVEESVQVVVRDDPEPPAR